MQVCLRSITINHIRECLGIRWVFNRTRTTVYPETGRWWWWNSLNYCQPSWIHLPTSSTKHAIPTPMYSTNPLGDLDKDLNRLPRNVSNNKSDSLYIHIKVWLQSVQLTWLRVCVAHFLTTITMARWVRVMYVYKQYWEHLSTRPSREMNPHLCKCTWSNYRVTTTLASAQHTPFYRRTLYGYELKGLSTLLNLPMALTLQTGIATHTHTLSECRAHSAHSLIDNSLVGS